LGGPRGEGVSLSGVGPRHCTEEGIQLSSLCGRAPTSGQRKGPAGRENPLDGLGRGETGVGVEESSSRLSGGSEPPGLRLEPGSPPGYTALLPHSPVRPKGMGQCGCPATLGGGRLEERVGLGLETARTPPVARTPKSWFLLCPWGSLFYPICCLDTECRLPQREGVVLTALGGPWQGWAG